MSHPFGDLLSQHLHRKHGLSQSKLAAGILQDPAVIGKMCKGQRLSGPQARERVLAIIGWLREQGALATIAEANALLAAADMAALHERDSAELALMQQLRGPAAPDASPPKAQTLRTNLPAPLTSFVGSERELAEIARLVAHHRLITLTGAGGVGKTRLALEVGLKIAKRTGPISFADGVWLVELAAVTQPTLIVHTVARLFQLPEQAGRAALDVLQEELAEKQLLLIFDNCEHLVEACAEMVERLLHHCWHLRVLATSREALRIAGEAIYAVPPLALPNPTPMTPEHVLDSAAVQLFVDRMGAAQPVQQRPAEDATAIAHICRQLDGIPLALELAAPLTQTMTLAEIAAQLHDQMALLTHSYRTVIPRHQTMYNALAWSYRLLAPAEQQLLTRLAVFTGSWTLPAAQAICAEERATRLATLLMQLVNKSWVVMASHDGQRRYRLLEPVCQFTQVHLAASGEQEEICSRHTDYFCHWLKQREKDLKGAGQNAAIMDIELNWGNLWAAWSWALSQAQFALLCQAVDGLLLYHALTGRFQAGEAICQAATERLTPFLELATSGDQAQLFQAKIWAWQTEFGLETGHAELASQLPQKSLALLENMSPAASHEIQVAKAFALRKMAYITAALDNPQAAQSLAEESLRLYQQLGDQWGIADALYGLGFRSIDLADFQKAKQQYSESLKLYEQLGDPRCRIRLLTALGWLAMKCDHYEEARQRFETALTLCQAQGDELEVADALQNLGMLALAQGRFAEADQLLQQSIVFFREKRRRFGPATSLAYLGAARMFAGRFAESRAPLEEGLAIAKDLRFPVDMALANLFLSQLNFHTGHYEMAGVQATTALSLAQEAKEQWLIGYAFGVMGWSALVQQNHLEAQRWLQKSLATFQENRDSAYIAWSSALLAGAEWGLGRQAQAQQSLAEALDLVAKTKALIPLLFILPLTPLVFACRTDANEAEKKRAVELYALAESYPMVANSSWFADVTGRHMTKLAETLPLDTVAAAKTRGVCLTVEETLAEIWGMQLTGKLEELPSLA